MTPRALTRAAIVLVFAATLSIRTGAAGAATAPFRFPSPTVRVLDNGLKVAVFPNHKLPIVQIQLLLPAGSAMDPTDAPGTAALTAELLRAATSSRDVDAFDADIDSLGGAVVSSVTRDHASLMGAFLSRDLEQGLELVSDAAMNPLFPEAEVRRAIQRSRQTALQRRLNPASAADDRIWAVLFEGHPYAHPTAGTDASAAVTPANIVAFHRARYVPAGAVLAIAGDVDTEKALGLAAEWFGGWAGKLAAVASVRPPAARPRVVIIDRPDLPATELEIATLAPARGDADELPIAIASQMFGVLPNSRLARISSAGLFARPPRSLAVDLPQGGLFAFGSLVPSDSTGAAVERMRDALRTFLDQGPTAAELTAAQRYTRNVYPMQFETLSALLDYWTTAVQGGLPDVLDQDYLARVGALTPVSVRDAARRWIDVDRLTVVAVGPAAVIEPQLRGFGPVEVVSPGSAPAAAIEPPPPFTASRDEEKKGQDLVKRAVEAHGGLKRLRKISDSLIEAEATLVFEGREIRGKMRQIRKDPWRMFYGTSFGGVSTDQVLNGREAWSINPAAAEERVQPMDSLGVAGMRAGFSSDILHVLLAASDPAAKVAGRGRDSLEDRAVERVDLRDPDGQVRRLYFDPSNRRLVALEMHEGATGTGFSTRRVFSDYRNVQGVQWPHAEERFLNGESVMRIRVTHVALDSGVEDSIFEKPEPALAPPSR